MNTTKDERPGAVAGQVDCRVRPVAQVQRMGSFQGVPHYGCLLNLEAEHRMKVNDPLYGQAELDAAVAAERERCAAIARRWGETHADGVTVNARNAASKIARGIVAAAQSATPSPCTAWRA